MKPQFYSNTGHSRDGEPGYYGTGMVDCSSTGPSAFIFRTHAPNAVVDVTDPDCTRHIDPETGEPLYAIECETPQQASALCAILNTSPALLESALTFVALAGLGAVMRAAQTRALDTMTPEDVQQSLDLEAQYDRLCAELLDRIAPQPQQEGI